MHIPDGFLSPPVWATFDVLSVPVIGAIARRAQRDSDDRRIPLLGVMGAFVFAAQMINFPVGPGISGHLVGGALLAITLGPSSAAIVMTAILAMQALFFQDGGILALGANAFNMAIAGVFAGYLPYRLGGRTYSSVAIFLGGVLSVLVSASLALSQLLISGVTVPRRLLLVSTCVFLVSALIEGAVTLAAVRAIERINPVWICAPTWQEGGKPFVPALAMIAALVLVVAGIVAASNSPDGIEKILSTHGVLQLPWWHRAQIGFTGIIMAYGGLLLTGKLLAYRKKRSA
jgi:cobalt/nickel transport system permease protein